MYCSNCGKQIQDNASFCTACGSKILHSASDIMPTAPSKSGDRSMSINIVNSTPAKRMNVSLRVLLCVVWFVFMAIAKMGMKAAGGIGIIPSIIYYTLLGSVMTYIWRK